MYVLKVLGRLLKTYAIRIVLAVTSIVHISVITYNILYPQLPEVKHYMRGLKKDFPITISICVEPKNILNVEDRIQELGYPHLLAFYFGESKFHRLLVGWSGHTENGSTLMTVEGSLSK